MSLSDCDPNIISVLRPCLPWPQSVDYNAKLSFLIKIWMSREKQNIWNSLRRMTTFWNDVASLYVSWTRNTCNVTFKHVCWNTWVTDTRKYHLVSLFNISLELKFLNQILVLRGAAFKHVEYSLLINVHENLLTLSWINFHTSVTLRVGQHLSSGARSIWKVGQKWVILQDFLSIIHSFQLLNWCHFLWFQTYRNGSYSYSDFTVLL